jgi:hypothetical protein
MCKFSEDNRAAVCPACGSSRKELPTIRLAFCGFCRRLDSQRHDCSFDMHNDRVGCDAIDGYNNVHLSAASDTVR